jgi:WD40 repeat protein/energy-coupling factor transporter ATP-binding protein EcfA2
MDLSGQVIKGYELHRRIGHGRFAMVYHASQPQVGRDVAVKVFQPEFANHPEFVRTFETEAQLIARLEHIHIVPLYDYWREPDRAFIVMRWLRDGTVRDSLARGGSWPVGAAARMLDQVAAALALAHRKGIIHRDVKPDNILLDEDGNALLSDFGIAATLAQSETMAKQGQLAGTPAYMAPELFLGEPASRQSDVYAMGVLMYEVLTNSRPFPDDTTEEAMRHHLSSPVPSMQTADGALPADLNLVVWRATAKSPDARYQSIIDLANAFREAASVNGEVSLAPPADTVEEFFPGGEGEGISTLIVDPLVQPDNPYKGLRPFEQADAADFFGREALVEQLLAHLSEPGARQRFLVLIGPSGSGKSSVVKAGLIPEVRQGALRGSEKWFAVEMVPGPDPFRGLEAALQRVAVSPVTDMLRQLKGDRLGLLNVVERILPPDDETRLLLLIDQFEEVFAQVESEADRKLFLDSLTSAATDESTRLTVVITLRADFYDRPLLYEGFGALVRECSEVILPLTGQELQAAIRNPAERVGLVVEPELLAAVVADVNQQPGALPLLQYALTEVFERRKGRMLTLAAYKDIGGITAALARRAEEVYSQLEPDRQELVRQLFLRLISLDEDTEATRRRLSWSALISLTEDHAAIEGIRDTFVKYRLLTMDRDPRTREPTVEVAHEALLREWGRLIEWLDANREDIQMQRRLQTVVAEWEHSGKDAGYLLTSTRLIQFEEWASAARLQLTQDERDFLETSSSERRAQQAAEAARLARERKLERRVRNWLIGIVVVFALAAMVASLLARYAADQKGVAEDRLLDLRLLSRADQINLALDDADPELALALAFTISDERDKFPLQTRQAFYRAGYTPATRLVFAQHQGAVVGVAISPDGTLVATGSGRISPLDKQTDNSLRIWKTDTGEQLFRLGEAEGGHTDTVLGVAFSPDGRTLATSSLDEQIILWDVETGTVIRRWQGQKDWVTRVAFTPDGQYLISVSGNFFITALPIPGLSTKDASVAMWDVATGELVRIFGEPGEGHQGPIMSLAISPDGRYAVTGDTNGLMIVWDIASGEEVRRMESPGDWVSSLAYTPDGRAFVAALGKPSIGGSGASSTVAALWDVETGERLRQFVGHTNVVIAVAVSPDGRTVLTASADNSLILWDINTGEALQRFGGHTDWVFGVVYTPDGRRAISASTDGTARVWDLWPGNLIQQFDTADQSAIKAVDISADGTLAVSGHEDGEVMVWDTGTGHVIRALGTGDPAHTAAVYGLALSPDATLAVSGDLNGTVTLWDVTTGAEKVHFQGHQNSVLSAAFSPDGQTFATSSGEVQQARTGTDNTIRLWDVATGAEIREFVGHVSAVWSVAFSPDGTRLASSSGQLLAKDVGSVRVWNVATGAELMRFEGHQGVIGSVTFSPDGAFVLSGSDDMTARLWNLKTGREERVFEGHTGFINTALFDADGHTIITGSDDDTIRLWNANTGEEIYRNEDYNDTIQDMALSADGRELLAVSANNELRLWRVDRDLDELIAWITANRHLRDLTCTERETYRVEPYCG